MIIELIELIASRHKILTENVSETDRQIQETKKSLDETKLIVSHKFYFTFSILAPSYIRKNGCSAFYVHY